MMSADTLSQNYEQNKKRKYRGEVRESRKKRKQAEREDERSDPATIVQAASQLDNTSLPDSEHAERLSKQEMRTKGRQQGQKVAAQPVTAASTTLAASTNSEDEDIGIADAPEIPQPEVLRDFEDLEADQAIPGSRQTEEIAPDQLQSSSPTAFYSTRLSLYLSIPSISLDSPLSAICALHLSPLLLTYYPPADGVVLAYQDPELSVRPPTGFNKPPAPPLDPNTQTQRNSQKFSTIGEEGATGWIWLTVTFLVYRPQLGEDLIGAINAQAEGLIGLVAYNYFQTSIGRDRIPKSWTWTGPTHETSHPRRKNIRKGRLNDSDGPSQDTHHHEQNLEPGTASVDDDENPTDSEIGTFTNEAGHPIPSVQTFRIVDSEIVPGYDRGKWSIQTEGTLLDDEQETALRKKERLQFETRRGLRATTTTTTTRKTTAPNTSTIVSMSGGLAVRGE